MTGRIPTWRAERLDSIRADRIARGGEPAPLDRGAVLREAVASHRLSGAECPYCGIDADDLTSHDCHCLRVDGERVAVGICCGRMLGAELLAAEDASDARPASRAKRVACMERLLARGGDVPDVPTPQVSGDE